VSDQTVGAVLIAVGGALLWSAWALVIVGVLAVLLPELLSYVKLRKAKGAYLAARADGGRGLRPAS
jgi:hypothetical protein